ncbi:uncharacterized protein EDB93DRAFT_788774 [Suillus bovinus]|uniref:uncharacterized protein n=1 Tax=Suillus bovinus TaxID=48563 RepID=UPI001B85C435|nr:uncharacterized protein EDB93DRAFT_788774 [Suillus bovinus]KAG2136381.1 hypothetical protein EDB93DRAFT_788774 [Suillus bovinus]
MRPSLNRHIALLTFIITTSRTSHSQTFVCNMKPIQFIYLSILAALVGVNAVLADELDQTCFEDLCGEYPTVCPIGMQSAKIGICWTCCPL